MAANGKFGDEIRGVENDYFDFDSRDFSDDDGRESESGTGSEGDGDSDDFSIGTVADESATPSAEAEPTAGMSTSGQPQAAPAGRGDGTGVAAPRTLRHRAKCRCKAGICADTFKEGDIDMMRAVNASMEKTQLDLLVLGKISTVISLDATTLRSKKAADSAQTTTVQLHTRRLVIHRFQLTSRVPSIPARAPCLMSSHSLLEAGNGALSF